MRFHKLAASAALGLAALGLSACAAGLNTSVTRHQAAAIPAGMSFYVVPAQGQPTTQFYRYAAMVAQQLEARGYKPAGAPQAADMLVRLDYGVDEGTTERVAEPMFPSYRHRWGAYGWSWRDPFYDPYWGVWGGRPYWSRWGGYPYYYGWDDPFWYASPYAATAYGPYRGGYGRVREYTVYKSYLDLDIVRRADNAPLFEGHARARSQTDETDKLVPPLIEAMFTGFPGKSGETVKITVPAKKS